MFLSLIDCQPPYPAQNLAQTVSSLLTDCRHSFNLPPKTSQRLLDNNDVRAFYDLSKYAERLVLGLSYKEVSEKLQRQAEHHSDIGLGQTAWEIRAAITDAERCFC